MRRFSQNPKNGRLPKPRRQYFRIAFKLNLKCLKTFQSNHLDEGLQLNLPKIFHFSFDFVYCVHSFGVSNFECQSQYEQITYLRCQRYYEWMKIFKNLEVLLCADSSLTTRSGFLASHPKLKCLQFNYCEPDIIDSLVNEAKKLNRSDLRLYVFSYLLGDEPIDDEKARSFWYLMTWLKAEYYREPSRMAPTMPFMSCLQYDNKRGSFDHLDGAFYAKLVEIQSVHIFPGSYSQVELIGLIKHFRSIVRIRISDCRGENLDQFYALLPQHCPYLRIIIVDNSKINSFFDLRFAFKLPELYYFRFIRPNKLCHRVDYLLLRLKLKLKREEIRKLNRELLFHQDSLIFGFLVTED